MPYELIVVFGLASALTAVVLVLAHRLSRTYLQDFVSDYYLSLLFRSPVALLGKPLTTLIARSMHLGGAQLDQFQLLVDGFVVKPLWILNIYFLLKCVVSFGGKKVPRSATAAYFLFWGAELALSWTVMFQFFQAGRFPAGAAAFENVVSWLEPFVALAVYGFGVHRASAVADRLRARGLGTFAWIGFISQAGFWLLIFLLRGFNVPVLVSAALPLPALLYLSSFMRKYAAGAANAPAGAAVLGPALAGYGITPREAEIVAQICAGRSNKAIGEALFISVHTVKRHVNQIYQKIDVKNRVQLANAVREIGKNTPPQAGG
jgi:DNA-binding CsgD family transcriptional regulator